MQTRKNDVVEISIGVRTRSPIQPCRDATLAALVVCLAFAVTVVFVWRSVTSREAQTPLRDAAHVAELAAGLVDAEMHAAVANGAEPDSELLATQLRRLSRLKNAEAPIVALYTAVKRGDGFKVVMEANRAPLTRPRYFPPAAATAFASNQICRSPEHETELGSVTSLFTPIRAAGGNVVGLVGADLESRSLGAAAGVAGQVLIYGTLFTMVCAMCVWLVVYRLRKTMQAAMEVHESRMEALEKRSLDHEDTRAKSSSVMASVSHEIRTPLTAILGFTELLLEPNDDFTVVRRHAQTIRRNSQHLLGVLNDALDISKLDAGKMRVHNGPFDPRALMLEVVTLFQPRAQEKHIGLDFDDDGSAPDTLLGDELRVRQIVLNLVSNALKFTERGRVTVSLHYDAIHAQLSCEVSDTGVGILPENLPRIFEPYEQSLNEDVRRFGGTGLGLTISKRLALLLGGQLTVASTPTRGTRFTLRIPAPIAPTGSGRDDAEVKRPDVWTPRPSWRVLLVEDTLEHQKIYYAILRRAGHSVDVCETGERAVNLVREFEYVREPYTIILLDSHLPGMSGSATARAIREHGFRGPILALSADATDEVREEALRSGCDDILNKPVDRETLLKTLARLVHGATSAGAA